MTTEELLDYLDNSLPKKRKKEIDNLLIEKPHYFNVLKGLKIIKNRFEDRTLLLNFLSKEKDLLANSIASSIEEKSPFC